MNNPQRLKTQIWDADGNEVWYKDGEAHTFVRNMHNVIATQILDIAPNGANGATDTSDEHGLGSLTLVDVTGTSQGTVASPYDVGAAARGQGYYGPVGNSTHGLVVGTGTSEFSFESFALGTPVISGSAAGEMAYSSAENAVVTFDSNSSRYSVNYARFFNNNTTASIVVAEIGMVSEMVNPNAAEVLICRDALSTTLTVTAGGQLKVTYTFTSQQFTS